MSEIFGLKDVPVNTPMDLSIMLAMNCDNAREAIFRAMAQVAAPAIEAYKADGDHKAFTLALAQAFEDVGTLMLEMAPTFKNNADRIRAMVPHS